MARFWVFGLIFGGLALIPGCGGDAGEKPPKNGSLEAGEQARPAPTKAAADTGGPWFLDEAAKRGVTLLNRTGRPRKKELIMGAVGPGAAVFDADGDGRLDLYVPNGNWLQGPQRTEFYDGDDRPRNALYIQQADGTFVDEAAARGVDDDAWGFGACAADLDNDGDQDLLVSNLGPNRLYMNDGKGHFVDVAEAAGVAGPSARGAWEWSTGIACGDIDRDGLLDVYVANYADMFKWLRENPDVKRDGDTIVQANVCLWQRLRVYCGPLGLPGVQDHLFRNKGGVDGGIRFEDVTKSSGVWRSEKDGGPRYGFQVLIADLDKNGWPDIYVANDSVPSFLFVNKGDGTFDEQGGPIGVAVGDNGEDMAGMGSDAADVTGDGWSDLHKTNFALQTNNIYVADNYGGKLSFRDHSIRMGVEEEVYRDLGWAVLVFDFDNDGDRDIFYANGHVYPEVDRKEAAGLRTTFEQYNRLFRNDSTADETRFQEVGSRLGPGFAIRKCSRGASTLDIDDDGDLDLLVSNLNSTPDLLINQRGAANGHWLRVRLVGDPKQKTNRDAIGTKVTVRAGDRTQYFETLRGRGFLGCSDPRLHVGLGSHEGPVTLEIVWPNGKAQTVETTTVDRELVVTQR